LFEGWWVVVGDPILVRHSSFVVDPQRSSSSPSSMGRTNAVRLGGGITESAPRTDFQMI
jgi:hypothetical protein